MVTTGLLLLLEQEALIEKLRQRNEAGDFRFRVLFLTLISLRLVELPGANT